MNQLIILTSDTRLGQVLSDEAARTGVSALVCADAQSVSREDWEQAQLAIADLDGKLVGTIPEHVRVLGLCHDPEVLSPRARRLAHVLYRRPFRMADLRAEFAALEVPPADDLPCHNVAFLQEVLRAVGFHLASVHLRLVQGDRGNVSEELVVSIVISGFGDDVYQFLVGQICVIHGSRSFRSQGMNELFTPLLM